MRTMPCATAWGLFFFVRKLGKNLLKPSAGRFPFPAGLHKRVNSFHQKTNLPMKKQLVFSFLFAFPAVFTAQTQPLTSARQPTPEVAAQKIRQVAEEQFDIFNNCDKDYDRDYHDSCDKCQKQKKSKKHNHCKGKGKHYGKHKNRGRDSSGSCHHCCRCESRKNRDCDDDDRWTDRDRRDRDDDGYRQQPQSGRQSPSPRVKSRPTPTAKKTASQPAAKRKVVSRPVGARN